MVQVELMVRTELVELTVLMVLAEPTVLQVQMGVI
jgi:hypothetical protein